MSNVEEMLMKLYWKMWTSADFESDFQSDWRAVYERMQLGDHYNIPSVVVEMCFQYLVEWEKER
jgi:hypothetical protein